MPVLLPMLFALPQAFGATDSEPSHPRSPIASVALGVLTRAHTDTGVSLNGALNVWQREVWSVEARVGLGAPRRLLPSAFPRRIASADAGAAFYWHPTEWLALGPGVSLSYRTFSEGTMVDWNLIPTLGALANVEVLRARSWSLGLATQLQVDTIQTEIIAPREEKTLSPFEAGLAVRFGFGRRKA